MNWILLAVFAYALLAAVSLADKFLLEKALPSSKAYTFLVSIAGGIVIFIAPFYALWPGWQLLLVNFLVGAIFPLALLLMYEALKNGEPSRVAVLVGGSVPLFTLLFSISFLGEKFTYFQWLALAGLIIAICLIIWLPAKENWLKRAFSWIGHKSDAAIGIFEAVAAGMLFAIFFIGSKMVYQTENFISGFIWLRLGSALAALVMLLIPSVRREIFKNIAKLRGRKAGIFFGNQLASSIGFSMQNYALSLGSVAIVTALQGVQYSLLIVFGAILSVFYPRVIKEKISRGIIVQKILAVLFVGLSLYLLTL
ncbi:MAG: DMT family transporter [Candidatus Falkowbacteria bacterium]